MALTAWVSVAPQMRANITEYNGRIYGVSGSALSVWDEVDEWVAPFTLPALVGNTISCMVVFNGKLYAGTYGSLGTSYGGLLLEWDGVSSAWTIVANRIGTNYEISSLVVFNGNLYAGTCNSGNLLQWSTDHWDIVAPSISGIAKISVLIVFEGVIYAASNAGGWLRWSGSAWIIITTFSSVGGTGAYISSAAVFDGDLYVATYNSLPSIKGGRLMQFDNVNNVFIEIVHQLTIDYHYCDYLTEYDGDLYAFCGNNSGRHLVVWDRNTNHWVISLIVSFPIIHSPPITAAAFLPYGLMERGNNLFATGILYYYVNNYLDSYRSDLLRTGEPPPPPQTSITSLVVYDGTLYGGTYPNGKLLEWNGTDAWAEVAAQNGTDNTILSLVEFEGMLYGGTYPGGHLLQWDGSAWIQVAEGFNSQTSIYALSVYEGQLYAGTAPGGRLFRWNGADAWEEVAHAYLSQAYIMALSVFGEELYGSTSPNGLLFKWDGVDDWEQVCGQLNSQSIIWGLTICNDLLYGGTASSGQLFWASPTPQISISSLCVYNGKLFAGTYPSGDLIEWNGADDWVATESALKLNGQTDIRSLIVYNNRLYGSTSASGKLFQWNNTNAWLEVASTANPQYPINAMAEFNGALYGASYSVGKLFRWDEVDSWDEVAHQYLGQGVLALAVYDNELYGSTYPNGLLFKWDGVDDWAQVCPQLGSDSYVYSLVVHDKRLYGGTYPGGRLLWAAPVEQTIIQSLCVYNGKLYAGTFPSGVLLEWNGTDNWVETESAHQLNGQSTIFSLAEYEGKLYGGTGNGGQLFQWNDTDSWVSVAALISSQTRIQSLAVFNGDLYGCTYPSGSLFKWDKASAWLPTALLNVGTMPALSATTLIVYGGDLYGATSGYYIGRTNVPPYVWYPYWYGLKTKSLWGGWLLRWDGGEYWTRVCSTVGLENQVNAMTIGVNGDEQILCGGTSSSDVTYSGHGQLLGARDYRVWLQKSDVWKGGASYLNIGDSWKAVASVYVALQGNCTWESVKDMSWNDLIAETWEYQKHAWRK